MIARLRSRAGRLVAALAALGAVAARAHATELSVDCPSIGEQALAQALAAELADHPAARAPALRVAVTCPSGDAAQIVIESADARRTRVIDLRDVPRELRVRLVALAVAEAMALLVTSAAPAAPAPAVPSAGSSATPPTPAPTTEQTQAPTTEQTPMPVQTPTRFTPHAASPQASAVAVSRSASLAQTAPAASPRFELVPSVGLRAYGPGFHVVPLFATDVGVGRWSFGASALTLTASVATGDVRLSVVAAGAGAQLACAETAVRLCLGLRADAGVTWASVSSVRAGALGRDVTAPYLALAARTVLSLPAAGTSARMLVDVGWAEGLIARAENEEVARADGFFVALGLGVRLW